MSWVSAALGKATNGLIGDKQPIPGGFVVPSVGATVQQGLQQGLQSTVDAAVAAAAKAAADAARQGSTYIDWITNRLPGNNQPVTTNQIVASLQTPVGLLAAGALAYLIFRKD